MHSEERIDFNFIKLISKIVKILKKNWKTFVRTILFSISSSLVIYFFTPNYYESHMSLYSELFNDTKLTDQLNEIKTYVANQDYKQLSKVTGLSIQTSETIKNFYTEIEPQDEKESIKTRGVFVYVTTTNQSNYDSIGLGVVNFLENNVYIKDRKTLQLIAYRKNIEQVTNEIAFLNNKREEIFSMLKISNGNNVMFADITLLSSRLIELEERKDRLNEQIKLYQDTKVTKNFQFSNRKAGPRILFYLISSLMIGILLSLIISFFPQFVVFLKKS